MRFHPSARLPRFRVLVTSLLAVAAVGLPGRLTFAQTSSGQEHVSLVRVQRPMSDDPAIDARLVAVLPTSPPVTSASPEVTPASPRAPAASTATGGPREPEAELQIAAVGPARALTPPQFNALWPTRGLITTYFGEVGETSPRGHSGIDVAAPEGTPIVAADDGEVLKSYWNEDGYGGLVVIAHPSGYETWYGHLARFDVEKGQKLKRGKRIGLMGSTGYSTGPHLHFEVRQDGQLRDPLLFLREANLRPADR
jgi:murein DD-endopeptidase MepM/ murein hydrolase activator NlpD